MTLLLLLACSPKCPDGMLLTADGACRPGLSTSDDSSPLSDDSPQSEPFILGDPQPCSAPLEGPRFRESGAEMGLFGSPASRHTEFGGSVVVDDLDGDGDVDIALVYRDEWPVLFRREGEVYQSESLVGAGDTPPHFPSLALADLDGDGARDILLASAVPQVFFARGGAFEATLVEGLALPEGREGGDSPYVRELIPLDVNGDGLLDLFVLVGQHSPQGGGGDESQDFLLIQRAGLRFEPVALEETSAGRQGFDAVVVDFNGDGRSDVYVVNDMDNGNVLYLGDGVGLAPDSAGARGCEVVQQGMGVDAADYNGDGVVDFYTTDTSHPYLLSGVEGGCIDATATSGLSRQTDMGWAPLWLDHDNDGELDLLVAQGDLWSATQNQETSMAIRLFRQDSGQFVDVGEGLGLAQEGSFRSAAAWDDNGDGVLDLLVSEVGETPRFYRSEGCTAEGWLEVEAPPQSRVEVEAGGRRQSAWTSTESGFAAGRAPVVHFGLGEAQTVELLRVSLPDGRVFEARDLEARRRVQLQD